MTTSLLNPKTITLYTLIGALNTALCLVVMGVGAKSNLDYLTYTALGYIISIFFSFFMNLRYTFNAKGQVMRRLFWFTLISVVNLVIVEILQYWLVEHHAFQEAWAIFIGMSWYVVTGYVLNQYWVYR